MTVFTPTDDGHADLSDHDSFVNGAPYNTFARMRREDPVAWCDYAGGQGFWSLTRHADILEANRNNQVFSSARGIRMEDQTYEEYLARRTFQETDPPEHSRTRVLVSKAFSKPVVALFDAVQVILPPQAGIREPLDGKVMTLTDAPAGRQTVSVRFGGLDWDLRARLEALGRGGPPA